MVSVTSEALANVSFQGAPARSGRSESDRSAGNDRFAALVDSNSAATNSDNRAQDSSNAPRRSDEQQAPSDNRARDNAATSDKAATDKAARSDTRNDSNDREVAVNARDTADADPKTAASVSTKSKPASSKSDASKSDESTSDETKESKPASRDGAAAADQTEAKADATAEITANAIASAIPVATATTEIAAVTPASDKATAPLAIAAAAIAATASLTGVVTGPAGADASATPAVTTAAAKTETSKIDAHASVAVATQATDTSVTSGIALAAAAPATTPGAPKAATQAKAPAVAKESAAISGEPVSTPSTTATAAPTPGTIVPSVTPQPEVAGQPKAESGIVDAAKAEIAGKSAPASANPHAAQADASQTLVNASNNSLPAAGALPTQQPAATTTPVAAPQLNVTAATSAAVPLSGLAMEIAASAKSGKSRFEIRLDPAELGRIDVRIDIDRHGQVTSHLTVERPETLSMLRQDASQLQRALDNAGLSTGNAGLQFSLRDQSSQGQNDGNQPNPNAHRLIVSEDDTVPATVAGRSYGRMLGSSGGVDIRI